MARYNRARGYARRGYGYARRGYSAASRSYSGRMGLIISPAFIAGAVIGLTDMDKKIPSQAVLGAATAPVRGMGMVKAGAQGIIFGNLLQSIKAGGLSTAGFRGI